VRVGEFGGTQTRHLRPFDIALPAFPAVRSSRGRLIIALAINRMTGCICEWEIGNCRPGPQ
jgi:hypothetical protein